MSEPERKRSRCVECSELKDDPEEFRDGLRCSECCDAAELAELAMGEGVKPPPYIKVLARMAVKGGHKPTIKVSAIRLKFKL